MIIHDVEQRSGEWYTLRAGMPTASEFNHLVAAQPKWKVIRRGDGSRADEELSRHVKHETAMKRLEKEARKHGDIVAVEKVIPPSEASEAYRHRLIAERIMGYSEPTFESQAMLRGKHMEDEAISYYEMMRDMTTDAVGFVTTDDGLVGCSPDRLVYPPGGTVPAGGLEIKCPAAGTHIGYLLSGEHAHKTYRHQVQGCLWVTGLQWWDMLSYHPELPPALVRVERDDEWHDAFTPIMQSFLEAVARDEATIKAMGYTFATEGAA